MYAAALTFSEWDLVAVHLVCQSQRRRCRRHTVRRTPLHHLEEGLGPIGLEALAVISTGADLDYRYQPLLPFWVIPPCAQQRANRSLRHGAAGDVDGNFRGVVTSNNWKCNLTF